MKEYWGETCSMHGRYDKCLQFRFSRNLKRRDQLEDTDADGEIILGRIIGK